MPSQEPTPNSGYHATVRFVQNPDGTVSQIYTPQDGTSQTWTYYSSGYGLQGQYYTIPQPTAEIQIGPYYSTEPAPAPPPTTPPPPPSYRPRYSWSPSIDPVQEDPSRVEVMAASPCTGGLTHCACFEVGMPCCGCGKLRANDQTEDDGSEELKD